jgi:hypothetical protein
MDLLAQGALGGSTGRFLDKFIRHTHNRHFAAAVWIGPNVAHTWPGRWGPACFENSQNRAGSNHKNRQALCGLRMTGCKAFRRLEFTFTPAKGRGDGRLSEKSPYNLSPFHHVGANSLLIRDSECRNLPAVNVGEPVFLG